MSTAIVSLLLDNLIRIVRIQTKYNARRKPMTNIKQRIAELVGMLPMMLGVLLEGYVLETPVKLNFSEIKNADVPAKNEGNPMTDYSKK